MEKPFNSLRAGLHSGAVLQVFVPWEAQMSASFYQSRKNDSVRGGMGSAGRGVGGALSLIYWPGIFHVWERPNEGAKGKHGPPTYWRKISN